MKRFKKFLIVGLSATVFASSLGLIACAYAPETLDGISVEISTTDSGCRLEWEKVAGVKYEVYRAPSRFGEYELIGQSNGMFEDEQHYAYYYVEAKNGSGEILATSDTVSEEISLFGEQTYIFAPTDDITQINSTINKIYNEMESEEFSDNRYAVFFKPGDYGGNITVKVPYYTTFAGLGESQDDVSLGTLNREVSWNTNSLITFWRGVENLSFKYRSKWAVSQGAFLRNVHMRSDLYLHDNYAWASGGFLADTRVDGTVMSGSQQQWFTRNSKIGSWSGKVWNMVFAGVEGAPTGDAYTTVESVSLIRSKPYLVFGESGYSIKVPALRQNTVGYTPVEENARTIPFEDIYFAGASKDTAASINAQIAAGKHIVFTPGVYELNEPIIVNCDNTVLLGTGLATLVPTNGNGCLEIGDVDGVSVCGLLFEAGTNEAENLAVVGTEGGNHADNPTFLFDCFFRVGGRVSGNTYTKAALTINANDCVTDNIWLWRADHGSGVGWDKNNGDYGLVVNSDNVKCYGLFAEHFKKHNVSWFGDNGNVIFFQSEIAYDVPSNEQWINENGGKGWASFSVHKGVKSFTAQGIGIYSNFHISDIELDSAMSVPETGKITVRNLYTVALSSNGRINNAINFDGIFADHSDTANGSNIRKIAIYESV